MTSEESVNQSTRAVSSKHEERADAPSPLAEDPPAVKPSIVWMIVPVLVIIVAMYLAS